MCMCDFCKCVQRRKVRASKQHCVSHPFLLHAMFSSVRVLLMYGQLMPHNSTGVFLKFPSCGASLLTWPVSLSAYIVMYDFSLFIYSSLALAAASIFLNCEPKCFREFCEEIRLLGLTESDRRRVCISLALCFAGTTSRNHLLTNMQYTLKSVQLQGDTPTFS